MKFLVILICLMVNYLWLKDLDRFDDGWFFRFRGRVEGWSSGLDKKMPLGWLAAFALIYGVPLLSLAVILFVTEGSVFGLITMVVHILVLLVAFDRTQPGQLAKDFLEKWKTGDMASCLEFLQKEFNASSLPGEDDRDAIGKYFSKQLSYRSFEKMFVMFFWYMCTGALGILFSYITCQLRDSHPEQPQQRQVDLISFLIQLLEWIPLRLLALTFSLAGNFVQCFENVRESFWEFNKETNNADLLYGYAGCAISGMVLNTLAEEDEGQGAGAVPDRESAEIQAILGLLERSQAIWLSVLALITIVGL
ncbi:MAG: regulatory signaling modulator protein AmpE [Gammaproteobacteria bacterium]|jgi:AmpE protein|nr:regulatory signaling modulator protein AmpE [Gammaproteobacteria bacterium]MDG2338517.1 regulatory signaling modulator protein AmpE [Gammaproteobacteria bacterium]